MTDLKEKKNIPDLRFSGFNGEWNKVRISDLYSFTSTNSLSRDKLNYDSGLVKNIHYGDIHTKFNTHFDVTKELVPYVDNDVPINLDDLDKFLSTGDLIVADASEDYADVGKAIEIINTDNQKIVSGLHTIHAKKESNDVIVGFIGHQMKNYNFRKKIMFVSQGAKVLGLSKSNFANQFVDLPQKEEQEKIASFLSTVDEKISLLEKQKKQWQKYKRGSIQKIFSLQVRFTDDNGNQFSEWKDMNLKKILKERKMYLTKNSGIEHVSLTKKGVVPKTARYERDFLVMQEDKKYRITYLNDICYNPANLKFGVICRNKFGTAIFSPIYVTFEIQGDHNPLYFEYFFVRNDFINMIRKFEEGTVYERMAVKPADFLTFNILVPSIGEQQKIASFLSDLDTKIEMINKEITQSKEWKKGLLQKMFV